MTASLPAFSGQKEEHFKKEEEVPQKNSQNELLCWRKLLKNDLTPANTITIASLLIHPSS